MADPVERCHAIGYPWFAETPSPTAARETVDAIGVVPVLSKLAGGLLSVLVSVSPRPLPDAEVSLGESEWSGMSGAPVVAAGMLLGVVIEQSPREGQSAMTAVPLTALEPDPTHPGWGPGVPDPAAWWSRLGVAGADELKRLPAAPERTPPPYWATLRSVGRTLHERMPQLLGRNKELAAIAAIATGADAYRWLIGGTYSGKTALLYEAVMVGLPIEVDADVDVVSYFLRRPASDADSNSFLAAVVPQLAYLCRIDPPPPANRNEFNALWERAAEQAAETRRHLLLVVDGLDEDLRPSGSPSVASLLPTLVGARTHVLVASRPYPVLPADVPDGHPVRARNPMELEPFEGATGLAELAHLEIDNLMGSDDPEVAVEVLGLLTAAAGPLSVRDLAELSTSAAGSTPAHTFQVGRFVTERAGRSLEPVGSEAQRRYQFAHYSLLEHAQENNYLIDPQFRERIHRWADEWRDRGWPTTTDATTITPRYLLDTYSGTLTSEPSRLTDLVTDPGWVDAAIQSVGVDRVLADLSRAAAAAPTHSKVQAGLATVRGQAHELSHTHPLNQPGYVSRQLWLQAAELAEDQFAERFRERLQKQPAGSFVPLWTTRRVSRAFVRELGRHDERVQALAVLPHTRVVSADSDGRMLVWDVAKLGSEPIELGRHNGWVKALGVVPDGRVVSAGISDAVVLWDVAKLGSEPIELGRHGNTVDALAVLPDGRVVTGGRDGLMLLSVDCASQVIELGKIAREPWEEELWQVYGITYGLDVESLAVLPDGRVASGDNTKRLLLLWDIGDPSLEPIELGRLDDAVEVVAALPDGRRVVSGDYGGRVLLWDTGAPDSGPVEIGRHERVVTALAVLADGRVVSGDYDGRLLLWNDGAPGSQAMEFGRHDATVRALVELQDGRVVSGGEDRRVLLWDVSRADRRTDEVRRHQRELGALAVLADGRVVSGDCDGRVLLWNTRAPSSQPIEIGRDDGEVVNVAVLPDGRLVSAVADQRAKRSTASVLLWDLHAPGAEPIRLRFHAGSAVRMAVLPDGRVVIGAPAGRSLGDVLLWDPHDPDAEPIRVGRHSSRIVALAVLPDTRVVSSDTGGHMLVWDTANSDAEPVELGRHDDVVREVAVLPDGRVVGGDGSRVLVWDVANPDSEPVELGRHDGDVRAVAVLPDGRVVSGDDSRLFLWDERTQSAIAQLSCSSTALAAGPRGRDEALLVIGHAGTGLSFWSIADSAPPR